MLIGHYAPALVLKRIRPSVKLWQLFLAAQFVDVLWSIFIVIGVEHVRIVPGFTESNDLDLWDVPYTHSLVATLGWTLFTFIAWHALTKTRARTGDAAVMAVAVASHFVADVLMHTPDLPLFASEGPKLGLGLWQNRMLAMCVETALFAAASLAFWLPHAKQHGSRAVAAWLIGLSVLACASFFTPTPPSATAMAITALALYAGCAASAAWAERKLDAVALPAGQAT